MGYYLVIGGEQWFPFASMGGMRELREWSDKLAVADFPEFIHFLDWGFCQQLHVLAKELTAAPATLKPPKHVQTTVDELLEIIASAPNKYESLVITNGLARRPPVEEDDEWWVNGKPSTRQYARELRYASTERVMVKSAIEQQSIRVQDRVAKASARYISRSVKAIISGIDQQEWSPNPSDAERQAELLVDSAFDAIEDEKMMAATIIPSLIDAAVEGAVAELRLVGMVTREKQHQSTTTTAEDAAQLYGIPIPEGVTVGDYPDWMRDAIEEELRETWKEPYWQKIPQTTRIDIKRTLRQAIRKGWSAVKIMSEITAKHGDSYSRWRAMNVARTETTNALNAGHVAGIKAVQQEAGIPVGKEWVSVLGSTTRETHAAQDGEQVDSPDANFTVAGRYKVPWPGHHSLPPEERCHCQCTVISTLVGEALTKPPPPPEPEPAPEPEPKPEPKPKPQPKPVQPEVDYTKMSAQDIANSHPVLKELQSKVAAAVKDMAARIAKFQKEYEEVDDQIEKLSDERDKLAKKLSYGHPHVRQMSTKIQALMSKRRIASNRLAYEMQEGRTIVHEMLDTGKDNKVLDTEIYRGKNIKYKGRIVASKKVDDGTVKKIAEAKRFFDRIAGRDDDTKLDTHTVNVHVAPKWIRAFQTEYTLPYYGDESIGVYIHNGSDVGVIVHEMAHAFEDQFKTRKPGYSHAWEKRHHLRAKQFKDYRIAKAQTKTVKLKDVFPKRNFEPWETGNPDDFLKTFKGDNVGAHYAGKDYSSSTEIVSMLAEELYRDPASLAINDPESFRFIVGLLRGYMP